MNITLKVTVHFLQLCLIWFFFLLHRLIYFRIHNIDFRYIFFCIYEELSIYIQIRFKEEQKLWLFHY